MSPICSPNKPVQMPNISFISSTDRGLDLLKGLDQIIDKTQDLVKFRKLVGFEKEDRPTRPSAFPQFGIVGPNNTNEESFHSCDAPLEREFFMNLEHKGELVNFRKKVSVEEMREATEREDISTTRQKANQITESDNSNLVHKSNVFQKSELAFNNGPTNFP